MFISIAIVDPKFLVITNVVKPVAIMLVQLVCCVGAESRPRFGRYHLCGKTCKRIATKRTPGKFQRYISDAISDYYFEFYKLKKGSRTTGKAVRLLLRHALRSRRF